MKHKVLREQFFERPAEIVARELLGKFLVRRFQRVSASHPRRSASREVAMMITEVEAYGGLRDRASHASRGKTARNAPMFGRPGAWYVYFTYGMHWMLNVVTGKEGEPSAVLIRGAIKMRGPAPLKKSRPKAAEAARIKRGRFLTGPARLTKKLGIGRRLNTKKATPASGLWIEDRGARIAKRDVHKGPRVGVAYAGRYWANRHLRFWVESPNNHY